MYPSDPQKYLAKSGPTHMLLKTIVPGLLGDADPNCNRSYNPPDGQPELVICEEVCLNGAAEDYIAGTNNLESNETGSTRGGGREHPVFIGFGRAQGRVDSVVEHRLYLQQPSRDAHSERSR